MELVHIMFSFFPSQFRWLLHLLLCFVFVIIFWPDAVPIEKDGKRKGEQASKQARTTDQIRSGRTKTFVAVTGKEKCTNARRKIQTLLKYITYLVLHRYITILRLVVHNVYSCALSGKEVELGCTMFMIFRRCMHYRINILCTYTSRTIWSTTNTYRYLVWYN